MPAGASPPRDKLRIVRREMTAGGTCLSAFAFLQNCSHIIDHILYNNAFYEILR